MPTQKNLTIAIRENLCTYGGRRSFTFVRERRGPGREYEEAVLAFDQLDRRARSLAVLLHELGQRDRPVLMLYPEGPDFLAAFVGCLYARVIAVPTPLPELSPQALDRARRIVIDADVTVLLTDAAHQRMLTDWLEETGLAGRVWCLATDTAIDAAKDADADLWSMPEILPDTPAFLQYTSGSTSAAKGVIVSHANLLHNEEEISRLIGSGDDLVNVGWLPHYHDMGLVGQLIQPLYVGGNVVCSSPLTFIRRPVLWLELISRHGGTVTEAPDFGYQLLLRQVTDEQMEGLDLSSLRIAMNGAEPVRTETLDRMVERFGPVGFTPEKWSPVYGMAETTLIISGTPVGTGAVVGRFDAAALTRDEAVRATGGGGRQLVSCGRPIALDVRVVAPETCAVLPDGRVGEIWIRGDSVAHGYWMRPAETEQTFRARTAEGDGPYLRTGDLGFRLDGQIYITGRLKDLIIVNGRNIYANDIEDVAQQVHPAARVAAAFSVDNRDDEVVVVQEISKRALGDTPPADLAAELRDAVARAFELPRVRVVLTGRGSVRRTTSGKIQRGLTRKALLDGELRVLAASTD